MLPPSPTNMHSLPGLLLYPNGGEGGAGGDMDTTLTPAEVAALSKDMDAALLGNAEDGTAAEGIARTAGMSVNELRKVLPDLPGPKAGNTRTSNNNNKNINGDNDDDDDEDYPQPQEEEGDGYVFVL